jgi:hypothetical protein
MSNKLQNVETFLTGYETRIYKGYKKTDADKLKEKKMIASTVQEVLATPVTVELSGELVEVPLVVDLIALKMKYLKEHPEKIDLKELSAVLGEQKQEVVIDTQKPSDIFRGVAIGTIIDDDSNT